MEAGQHLCQLAVVGGSLVLEVILQGSFKDPKDEATRRHSRRLPTGLRLQKCPLRSFWLPTEGQMFPVSTRPPH